MTNEVVEPDLTLEDRVKALEQLIGKQDKSMPADVMVYGSPRDFISKKKQISQVVNNSATLVDCVDMFVPIAPDEVWAGVFYILFTTGTTPDLKADMVTPAGVTGLWHSVYVGAGALTGANLPYNSGGVLIDGVGVGTQDLAIIHFLAIGGSTPGNVQFKFAQNTANGSDTTVLKGSTVIAHRIPTI